MRNRKSPCLTSETFLPLMVRNQILVLSFFKTLFFNKLLHGSKKPAGLITSPQTTDSCQPLWQLSSYICLCSPEMEIASAIKVMGDCKKLSSGIVVKLSFRYLGRWGWEKMLGIFVWVTNYFKHLSFITSFFTFLPFVYVFALLPQIR